MNYIFKNNLKACLGIITQSTRNSAVPGGFFKKGTGKKAVKKVIFEYETDANKLVNYVCGSNIYKTGEDIKVKDDSEYPDWLWKISMDSKPRIEDLSPDSKKYWRLIRKQELKMTLRKLKQKKF